MRWNDRSIEHSVEMCPGAASWNLNVAKSAVIENVHQSISESSAMQSDKDKDAQSTPDSKQQDENEDTAEPSPEANTTETNCTPSANHENGSGIIEPLHVDVEGSRKYRPAQ